MCRTWCTQALSGLPFYDWSMNIHRKARREDTFCFLPQEIYSTNVLPISKENIHILTLTKKNTRFKLGVLRHSWQLGWSLPARVQQKHSAGLEGRNPSEEVFGHTALFFVSVKWFKEFLLVSCCLLSSHLTGRWKWLEKKVAIQKITSFRFPKTLDQHQQLHFTISHSFRDVRPKANLQNPTKVAGCDINNG